jgi:trigger factor
VVVAEVQKPKPTAIDEDLATNMGLESLEQLRGLLKGQMEQELGGLTRTHMKRKLLDQLAAGHDFPVPPSMVEAEFNQIWAQLQQEAAREEDPEAAKAEMEAEREEYRAIAERRVRLGLLLSEIGQANKVQITQQEMQMLMQQAAQQYPADQREQFFQFIQQNEMAAAQLRAPLYEDKVVDFLFDKAIVTERTVTREELEAAIEADEAADAETVKATPAKKAASKKPAAKKAPAKKAAPKTAADAGDGEAEKPAAKKAPAKKAPAKKSAAEE